MSGDSVIYDFETLSTDRIKGIVTCIAGIRFSEDRYLSDNPYTFAELAESAQFMKFDVLSQAEHYGRQMSKSTIDWWRQQPKKVQEQLVEPSDSDVPLTEIKTFFDQLIGNHETVSKVYSRGNTFDPILVSYIFSDIGAEQPYPFWKDRDTRSMIEGLSYGADLKNSFMVPGLENQFIAHDPRHDIAMDVMRMQYILRLLNDMEL